MTKVRTLTRSFGGGELSPEFYGQVTDAKYQIGLALCLNAFVLPHGPAANRPGTRFVREVKDSSKKVCLLPFTYSTTQTYAIELGEHYIRFHTQGATLTPGTPTAWSNSTAYTAGQLASLSGTNYYCILGNTNQTPPNATYWYAMPAGVLEVPTPYAEADLFDVHIVQSADVLTLVHPNYAPRELRRLGATTWELRVIAFSSSLSAPSGVTATVGHGSGSIVYSYKVAALADQDLDEGPVSSAATVSNDLSGTGAYNTITWSAVTGATRYKVFKEVSGIYGYIGTAEGLTFKDDNIASDMGITPGTPVATFSAAGDYPGAVTYTEQRRLFGGTTNKPANFWLTKPGTESNMNASLPTLDGDAIAVRTVAREANTIRHAVPLNDVMLLTSAAEWRVYSNDGGGLTPSTTVVKPQSYIGSSNVQPVTVNNNLVFAAARGGHMRELAFSWQSDGYITGDLSLRAPHLFDGMTITDMAYAKAPYPIVFATSSNGEILSFTYVPEQQIGAWSHSSTINGSFESVTCVAEGDEDAIYVVVKRTIGGATKRFVERFASRLIYDIEDSFFVDCGATYDGVPADVISGFPWLEGETVSILADGAVQPPQVVTSGAITLGQNASVVQIGLPITTDIKTLPLYIPESSAGQGMVKNINVAKLRVAHSSGVFAGPSFDELTQYKQRTTEPMGSPPALSDGIIDIVVTPMWNDEGIVCVRQTDPLPLTLVAIAMEATVGG